ncbi:MAG: cupin domain-containing protein [Deltaproteobacteria bacterium]|nr:cupin domain-containing protein [Deltaproteobacteria bacterium]
MKLVKTNDVTWADALKQGNYGQRRKELGSTGKMSAGLWELAPGKKSFPFHMHHVTEEALFVVSGTAKVRTPDGLTAVGAGDWVAFPPGAGAHQLINDGTEPFIYLALGVSMGVDVVEYPDSGKVSSAIQAGPERKRYIFKKDTQVEYFAGDEDAKG